MNIKTFYFNPYRECTYVVDNGNKVCFVVDPGMYGEREQERMSNYLSDNQMQVFAILITHSHIDHICGLEYLRQQFPQAVVIGENFSPFNLQEHNQLFVSNGFFAPQCILTPGHKEDCVCYYFKEDNVLFSGDTLFQESVGRTDLEGGDMVQLHDSLSLLMQLPDQTIVYPGHAYPTSIGHEKDYNPFI